MPSPTSSTSPTSRDSSCCRCFSISALITETISPGLNLIVTVHQELSAQAFDLGLHRAVQHAVADLHDHAAEQLGDHALVEDRLQTEIIMQFGHQRGAPVFGQRHGTADLDAQALGPQVVQIAVASIDTAEQFE